MQVRFPKWDFSKVRAHWAPHREFAQMQNAASTVPAYIEPYLVKVMLQAQAALPTRHEKLHKDLAIFIKQEMQHCRQHLLFNKALRADGYEGMLAIEKEYEADYDRFLKTKSLRFNVAYSEGFEAVSSVAVDNFFEDFAPFLLGLRNALEIVGRFWGKHGAAPLFAGADIGPEAETRKPGAGPGLFVFQRAAFYRRITAA